MQAESVALPVVSMSLHRRGVQRMANAWLPAGFPSFTRLTAKWAENDGARMDVSRSPKKTRAIFLSCRRLIHWRNWYIRTGADQWFDDKPALAPQRQRRRRERGIVDRVVGDRLGAPREKKAEAIARPAIRSGALIQLVRWLFVHSRLVDSSICGRRFKEAES